jgi:hypothetical protein
MVDQSRCEKEHRGVEVQDRGDGRYDAQRQDERRARAGLQAGEPGACGREQAVTFCDDADQEAGDQRERRPDLGGGRS